MDSPRGAAGRTAFLSYSHGEPAELRSRVIELLDEAAIGHVVDDEVVNPLRLAVDVFLLDLLEQSDLVLYFEPTPSEGARAVEAPRSTLRRSSMDVIGRLRAMLDQSEHPVASRVAGLMRHRERFVAVALVAAMVLAPIAFIVGLVVATLLAGRSLRLAFQRHVLGRTLGRGEDESWQEWERRVAGELGRPVVVMREPTPGTFVLEGPSSSHDVGNIDESDVFAGALDALLSGFEPAKSRISPSPELKVGCLYTVGYLLVLAAVFTAVTIVLLALMPAVAVVLVLVALVLLLALVMQPLLVAVGWVLAAVGVEAGVRGFSRRRPRRDPGG